MSDDWNVFANCKWDPASNSWEMMKREIHHVY